MEERTGEISVHRDVLKVELRGLNEEKHRSVRTYGSFFKFLETFNIFEGELNHELKKIIIYIIMKCIHIRIMI